MRYPQYRRYNNICCDTSGTCGTCGRCGTGSICDVRGRCGICETCCIGDICNICGICGKEHGRSGAWRMMVVRTVVHSVKKT